jgi:hypothetical protein
MGWIHGLTKSEYRVPSSVGSIIILTELSTVAYFTQDGSMSTVKNPEEKKQLSLARDRRNTFGENNKSSRKNIRRGKQRRHMDERRTVAEALGHLKGDILEDQATEAELRAKIRIIDSERRGFKKRPDTPLGAVLEAKRVKKKSRERT